MSQATYEETCHGTAVYGLSLGAQKMPPGYRLDRLDSGHYRWVRPVYGTGINGDPDDHEEESEIDSNRWSIWRGAWANYRRLGKPEPRTATQGEMSRAIRGWEVRNRRKA